MAFGNYSCLLDVKQRWYLLVCFCDLFDATFLEWNRWLQCFWTSEIYGSLLGLHNRAKKKSHLNVLKNSNDKFNFVNLSKNQFCFHFFDRMRNINLALNYDILRIVMPLQYLMVFSKYLKEWKLWKSKFCLIKNSNSNLTVHIFFASLWTVCSDYLPAQCCRASLVSFFLFHKQSNILHSTLFPCFLKAEWNWNKRGYLAPWYMIFFHSS